MANTVYGPYAPTTWVDGTTVGNQTHMNNIEKQASIGLNGFNGDLLTPFVLSGLVCTKDGTIANQLDVTAGRVYIQMTDGTVGLIVTAASVASQFLTATPSTTYYLDLNPDGTWSWGTSHSVVTHHLTICSVTTDASGNILVVTDARTLNTTILSGMAGRLTLPTLTVTGSSSLDNGHITTDGAGDLTAAQLYSSNGFLLLGAPVSGHYPQMYWSSPLMVLAPPAAGAANGIVLQSWDGTTSHNPFSVGGQFGAAPAYVDNSGNYNGPAGGGVPTTRNGAATTAAIYTSTATPTGNGTTTPATGALWAKA